MMKLIHHLAERVTSRIVSQSAFVANIASGIWHRAILNPASSRPDLIFFIEGICPTPAARELFNADYVVWVDTIKEGRFADTNAMFVKPEKYDYHVTTQDAENWAPKIAKEI